MAHGRGRTRAAAATVVAALLTTLGTALPASATTTATAAPATKCETTTSAAAAAAAAVAQKAAAKPPAAAVSSIKISAPAAPVTLDAGTYVLKGTAPKGSLVLAWVDANGNGTRDRAELLAGADLLLGSRTTWSITVRLAQNAVNRFVLTDFDQWKLGPAAVVPAITESAGVDIAGVTDSPDPFSPNGDGTVDSSAISYTLSQAAKVTIALTAANGTPVKTLVVANRPKGLSTEVWDGAGVADGTYAYTISAPGAVSRTGTTTVDTHGPAVSVTSTGSTTSRSLTADATDPSGVASVAFSVSADGTTWTPVGTPDTAAPWSTMLPADLPDGPYQVRAVARDAVGVASTSAPATLTLDTTAPAAPTGLTAADVPGDAGGSVALAWTRSTATDVATQCVLRATGNGAFAVVASLGAGATTFVDTGLTDGTTYAYTIEAIDGLGQRGARAATATAVPEDNHDRTAPQTGIEDAQTDLGDATFTLTSSEPGSTFECALDDADFVACTSPLSLTGLAVGDHTLSVRATDAAGNTDTTPASTTWTVPEPPNGLPQDPSTVATPIDATVPTDVAGSTSFLYTGPHPIQVGVAPGTIVAQRASVVRGQVVTRGGDPLDGVTVSIDGHPELGHTVSRADGGYDLAVNGGGPLVVRYAKDGYPEAQREATPSWDAFTTLDDVVLVPFDSKVTAVDFTDPIEVAQGSPVTDTSGTRQATLLFAQGTVASMTLPDGTTQTLDDAVHVRATEFTVGTDGPKAMPGDLPAASGYTYAAEYSLDEAVAAGASKVTFSKPVANYTDNFLSFPVGTPVPTGYYDRTTNAWVAAPNGRVVKILSITGGQAVLDVAGKGVAATPAELATLGITDAERAKLASLYPAGKSLWRVSIDHFTPWDHNWPFGPPANASYPKVPELVQDAQYQCQGTATGSIIGCDNQTLGEAVSVAGSNQSLHYQSERTPGRSDRNVRVPLTGATLAPGVQQIILRTEVAGQVSEGSVTPSPNMVTNVSWDGKDPYGRVVQGAQLMRISVGYEYQGVYNSPAVGSSSFGGFGGDAITGSRTRQTIVLWTTREVAVGHWDARGLGLGGWSLSGVHAYDPVSLLVHRGDGSTDGGSDLSKAIAAFAGTGTKGFSGDNGPASAATFATPYDVAVAPDGTAYVADTFNQRVRAISPTGTITTIAGIGIPAGTGTPQDTGDGGPATAAALASPHALAVAPDGSVLVATNNRVRRIATDGTISTIAGTGMGGWAGDGGPATAATVGNIPGMDVGPDGTVYLADQAACRVRAIGVDGIIRTVAGLTPLPTDNNARCGFDRDGLAATKTFFSGVTDVAVTADGALLVADSDNHRVRRVGTDGLVQTVVGGTTQGDGIPAVGAQLSYPHDLTVLPDGSFLVTEDQMNRVRIVTPDGMINAFASNTRTSGNTGDGGTAQQARLYGPRGTALLPDGRVLIADTSNNRLRVVATPMPGFGWQDQTVVSQDGGELYQFSHGRHVQTRSTLTGAVTSTIAYDPVGRLTSVTDGDGNVTSVERSADGRPTAIVAPGGQRTELSLDDHGYLAAVEAPGGLTSRFSSSDSGLLETYTDPKDGVHRFTYDYYGLLQKDEAPDGVSTTLTRQATPTGQTVTATSTLGRVRSYGIERLPNGQTRRTTVDATGATTVGLISKDGTRSVTNPDGSTLTVVLGPDPRFGMAAPITATQTATTPSGRSISTTTVSTATLTDPADLLAVKTLTTKVTTNGLVSTQVYDRSAGTITATSPQGRSRVATLDAHGRVVRTDVGPGVAPIIRHYDGSGRLTSTERGSVHATYGYDATGRLTSTTDSANRTTTYGYDEADRLTSRTTPGGAKTRYGYDANGNVTTVTLPSGQVHRLDYQAGNRPASYDPPGASAYTTIYDTDGAPTGRTRPGGPTTTLSYDPTGRLVGAGEPQGSVTYQYGAVKNRVSSVTADPGDGGPAQVRSFGTDGFLLTGMTVAGPTPASFAYTYDANLQPSKVTLTSGSDTASYDLAYDNDGLVVRNGAFTFTRDAVLGTARTMTDGTGALAYDYDDLGRLTHQSLTVAGAPVYGLDLTRGDTLEGRTETVGGVSSTLTYTLDDDGRLTDVTRDGSVVEHYAYDVDGRRTLGAGGAQTYDEQDRLVAVGSVPYGYTADGSLATRGSDQFAYGFDGQLTSATVDGTTVTYGYDAEGRRTTRTDAAGTTQYLYGSPTAPDRVNAVRTPDGVLTTLTYDSLGHVVSYLRDGARFYVGTDQVGSPRVVTDAAGTVLKQVTYDAYGTVLTDSAPSVDLPVGFAGGLPDAATGLVRFGQRDYEPGTGRWTTRDPAGFAGGQTDLYGYVGNHPTQARDLSGLSEEEIEDIDPYEEIPNRTAWETAEGQLEKVWEWAKEKAWKKAENKFSKVCDGPVCLSTQKPEISVGAEIPLEINGEKIGDVGGDCSLSITPSHDPRDYLFAWKVKLTAKIEKLSKLPFGIGDWFKTDETYSGEFGRFDTTMSGASQNVINNRLDDKGIYRENY